MEAPRWARSLHAVTAATALVGLGLQLLFTVTGAWETAGTALPPLGIRLWRFVSYFTIQSNVIVAAIALTLAVDPLRDGRLWRVIRLDAVSAIIVTGVVHWFLLRPEQHLDGWLYASDKVVHVVVPLLVVASWLIAGPRPRITLPVALAAMVWPVGWVTYTMVVGGLTCWYPYDFLDVCVSGALPVTITCLVMTALMLGLNLLLLLADRRLPATDLPARPSETSRRGA